MELIENVVKGWCKIPVGAGFSTGWQCLDMFDTLLLGFFKHLDLN